MEDGDRGEETKRKKMKMSRKGKWNKGQMIMIRIEGGKKRKANGKKGKMKQKGKQKIVVIKGKNEDQIERKGK